MRRSLVIAALTALLLASCGGDDSDGSEAAPGSSTSTTAATTTTGESEPEPNPADALCRDLPVEPYEVRKALLDAAGEEAAAEAECPDLVADLEAAIEIERTAAELRGVSLPAELLCDESELELTVTNDREIPLGIAGAARRHPEDTRDPAVRVGAEFVHWRIEPGETVVLTIPLPQGGYPSCSAGFEMFVVDERPIDASVPGVVADHDQASDDPEVWFPATIDVEREARRATDPTGIALTEDIRSAQYSRLVEEIDEPNPAIDRPIEYGVCKVLPGPDERRVAVVYQVERGAYSFTDENGEVVDLPEDRLVAVGAFRRGADGRWRWLMRSVVLDGRDCLAERAAELGG